MQIINITSANPKIEKISSMLKVKSRATAVGNRGAIRDKMEQIESALTLSVQSAGYDGAFFVYALRMSVDMQKTEGKSGTQIRYSVYRHWARELKRVEVGFEENEKPQYDFPDEAAEFLRKLTGGPAKREKKQVAVKVPIETLCRVLAVPKLS